MTITTSLEENTQLKNKDNVKNQIYLSSAFPSFNWWYR